MSEAATAQVLELPKKVKVLCFYEARRYGTASGNIYWQKGAKMIEVTSSSQIAKAFDEVMTEAQVKANPWDRQKLSAWRLTAYLPETLEARF